MSSHAMSAKASRMPQGRRSATAKARHDDAINPARGVMMGLGISAVIWTGIGALLLR